MTVSVALDSAKSAAIGEPHLVAETEAGLRELGLYELALCFSEAKELMLPILAQPTQADGDLYEILERAGLKTHGTELDRQLGH